MSVVRVKVTIKVSTGMRKWKYRTFIGPIFHKLYPLSWMVYQFIPVFPAEFKFLHDFFIDDTKKGEIFLNAWFSIVFFLICNVKITKKKFENFLCFARWKSNPKNSRNGKSKTQTHTSDAKYISVAVVTILQNNQLFFKAEVDSISFML